MIKIPRIARNCLDTSFFHVMVQGINKEYIFKNNRYIKRYLQLMKEKLNREELEMIAYCIMNNHAHFLIYTEDIKEISKLMSQINTKYAMFYNKSHNRCGIVFRNRYRSEQIVSYSHLISCANYIHNNPVKARMCLKKADYKYSSYNEYIDKSNLLNKDAIYDIFRTYDVHIEDILKGKYESYNFIEYIDKNNKEKNKENVLEEFLEKNDIKKIEDIINSKEQLKRLSYILHVENHFTQKEIAEVLGVNRLKIHRILNGT